MGKQVISNKDLLYNNINSDREPVKTRFQKKAQLCGICYCNIEEQGLLNSCRHEFCFSCINRWSKKENTCPICKRRFINIKRKWKRKCYAKLFREFKKRQQNNIKVSNKNQCNKQFIPEQFVNIVRVFHLLLVNNDIGQGLSQEDFDDNIRVEIEINQGQVQGIVPVEVRRSNFNNENQIFTSNASRTTATQ